MDYRFRAVSMKSLANEVQQQLEKSNNGSDTARKINMNSNKSSGQQS